MKMTTKELCIQGLLTALVTVCTMVFQIPVSATQGYIHLGDSMILLTSVFFGWKYGMAAGGIGSALADLLSGYAHWAPFTLIIKGGMGLLIGGGILKSSFAVAATSIPENLVQGAAGMAIFLVVGTAFYKAKIYRFVSEK